MKKEFIKLLKINILSGILWIVIGMVFYYYNHSLFSIDEFFILLKPVIGILILSIALFFIHNFLNKRQVKK